MIKAIAYHPTHVIVTHFEFGKADRFWRYDSDGKCAVRERDAAWSPINRALVPSDVLNVFAEHSHEAVRTILDEAPVPDKDRHVMDWGFLE